MKTHICNECNHTDDMGEMKDPICEKCGSTMYKTNPD